MGGILAAVALRAGAARARGGDMGRDVIGYLADDVSTSPADVYQCKAYGHRLRPSDVWVEFGKVCVYSHRGEYRLPRKFLFVSTHGVGPKLHRLLENPEELKRELIEQWPKECETKISERAAIPLDGDLRATSRG